MITNNTIETIPANVQIVYTHSNGCTINTLCLPEGETAEQMGSRLLALFHQAGTITIREINSYEAKTQSDFKKEWVKDVIEGYTSKGLFEWYQDNYGY